MKKIVAFVLSLIMIFALAACDLSFNKNGGEVVAGLTQLPSTTITHVDDNYIYWDEVPNASSYVVKVNNYQENAGNQLKYSISSILDGRIESNAPIELHIYVKAKGNQVLFSDSEWSGEYTYTYMPKNSTPGGSDSDSPVGTYLQTGVGQTIDVVTATSYNNYKTGVDVLDSTKLRNASFNKKDNKENNSSNNAYKSIDEVYEKGSLSYDVSLGMKGFINNYNINFQASTSIEYRNIKDSYYFILDHYINRYTLSLSNYSEEGYYINYLSEDYLAALSRLGTSPSRADYYAFFEKYGTHLIASGIFGGRLNAYYTVVDKTSKFTDDIRYFLTSTVSAAANGNSVSAGASAEIQNYFEKNSHTIETNFKLTNFGGNSVGAVSLDGFGDAYSEWVSSFNADSSNSVLIGYERDGLIALWDLLPSSYLHLKGGMIDAFTHYYEEYYNEYIKEFSFNNTVDYAGGTGTTYDPYLIGNEIHLKNIDLNLDASFELIADIDLSGYRDWNAIGGHYKTDNTMFNGVLDGKGHTIRNLKRTTDITEKNDRIYFGLFGRIGSEGVVKNLVFENVSVNAKGPAVDNGNTKVFFGVVAGALYGTVSNVQIRSGSFSYDCDTNGCAFVGSIAGVAIECTVNDCVNDINLTSGRYSSAVGGIAGYAAGVTFINCTNNGKLQSYCSNLGGAWCGGIVGERYSAKECIFNNAQNNGSLAASQRTWFCSSSTNAFEAHITDSYFN